MNLTITLHCQGKDSNACPATITADYIPGWRVRIHALAEHGGWVRRPVAVIPSGDMIAVYCPECHDKLLNRAATQLANPVDAHEPLRDLLLCVNVHVTLGTIDSWTKQQREQASEWAAREHLSASDNPVRRIPKPEFLP